MPNYTMNDIRNIAVVGHSGSGKTTLCEAFLHDTGVTSRLGSVADKTSHLDVDDEEKERGYSIESHVFNVNYDGKHLNFIDTPGSPDFIGNATAALAAVEVAMVVVHAAAGLQVNTRRMRDQASNFGLGRVIVINRIDAENADLKHTLAALQEAFGPQLTPVTLPAGGGKSVINCFTATDGTTDLGDVAAAHKNIVERLVEVDDDLLAKYLETGDVAMSEVDHFVPLAIAKGAFVPVFFTNAKKDVGVKELLEFLAKECPSPAEGKQRVLVTGGNEKPVDPKGKFCGQVFKVAVENKSNIKYAFIRGLSGTLKPDANLVRSGEKKGARPGHIIKFQGGDHKDTDVGIGGDIFAVAKLDLHVGDTVFEDTYEPHDGKVPMIKIPKPMFSLALEPKARGEEAKIADAVRRFSDVDPAFETHHDPQTHELVISGVGDLHLRVILSKMHRQFKLDVNTKPPKIPYRETISMAAEGHHRHKKQTGGAGQFGEVYLKVEPLPRGSEPPLEWSWDIFGGSIPGQFEPAIRKGVNELLEQGALAGYRLQDIKVMITDGKHHPVDSKEVAFKTAGKYAFKDAILKAKPVLLEPIVNIEVTCPADHMGDITGDLAQRRGRPSGQDMLPGNMAIIQAQVPLAKIADYHSRLSSMTGGKGSYAIELSHYEPVPSNEAQAIIAAHKPHKDEDE